jgi:NDP-sugar pyrophosphorylase family protein
MINVVFPLVDLQMDDSDGNLKFPLALKEVNNKTFIEYSIGNYKSLSDDIKFIFILNERDCVRYHVDNALRLLVPDAEIIVLKNVTAGALCSVLMAIDKISLTEELLIVNYDQFINFNIQKIVESFRSQSCDGGVVSFRSVHPRWSFARITDDFIVETAVKNPISENALVGIYYFREGGLFFNSAFEVIKVDDNYNGSYYTSSVYNQMVLNGLLIGCFKISGDSFFPFYSVQKIKEFELFLTNGKK